MSRKNTVQRFSVRAAKSQVGGFSVLGVSRVRL